MHQLKKNWAALDQKFVWHPFTQMSEWMKQSPVVVASAQGAELTDVKVRTVLDANSSISTNLHGHNHPVLNAALETQLKSIAHSSALGLANIPAAELSEQLVCAAGSKGRPGKLRKVFFS